MASDLLGSVNVAKVDATEETATASRCRSTIRPSTTTTSPTPSPSTSAVAERSLHCFSAVLSVGIAGFPTLFYLSQGRMFEYRGSRTRTDLVDFARNKQLRGRTGESAEDASTPTLSEGEEEGRQEEVPSAGDGGEEAEDVTGRPIPPVPTTWDLVVAAFVQWSERLTHVLLSQPTVAGALLLMGALIGVLLSTLVFTLTLDNRTAPPPYAPIPKAMRTDNGGGSEGLNPTNKVVKGE